MHVSGISTTALHTTSVPVSTPMLIVMPGTGLPKNTGSNASVRMKPA
ncbi:MAG: hypothetical protein ACN6PV_24595 [Achromobacter sp.]